MQNYKKMLIFLLLFITFQFSIFSNAESQLVVIQKDDSYISYSDNLDIIDSQTNQSNLMYMRNAQIKADLDVNTLQYFNNNSVNLNIADVIDYENGTNYESQAIEFTNSSLTSKTTFDISNRYTNALEKYNQILTNYNNSFTTNEVQYASYYYADFANHKNVFVGTIGSTSHKLINRWNNNRNVSFNLYLHENNIITFGYGSVKDLQILIQTSNDTHVGVTIQKATGGYATYHLFKKFQFVHFAVFSISTDFMYVTINDVITSSLIPKSSEWLTTFMSLEYCGIGSPNTFYIDNFLWTENGNNDYLFSNFRTTNDLVVDLVMSVKNANYELVEGIVFPLFTFALDFFPKIFVGSNRHLFNFTFGLTLSNSQVVGTMGINGFTLNSFPIQSREDIIHIYFRFYDNIKIDFGIKTNLINESSTVYSNSEIAQLLGFKSANDITYANLLNIYTYNVEPELQQDLRHYLYALDSNVKIEKYKNFRINNRTDYIYNDFENFTYLTNWNTQIRSTTFYNYNFEQSYFQSAEPNIAVIGPCADAIRFFNLEDYENTQISETNNLFFNSMQIQKALHFEFENQNISFAEYSINVKNTSSFTISSIFKLNPKVRAQFTFGGLNLISFYSTVLDDYSIRFYIIENGLYSFTTDYNPFFDSVIFSLHYNLQTNKYYITIQYNNRVFVKHIEYEKINIDYISIRFLNYVSIGQFASSFDFLGLMIYPYLNSYENYSDFSEIWVNENQIFGKSSGISSLFTINHANVFDVELKKPTAVPILNYKIIYSKLYKIEYEIVPEIQSQFSIQRNICPSVNIVFLSEFDATNFSGYFIFDPEYSFNFSFDYGYGLIGFGKLDNSIQSIVTIKIKSYWICVIEYYENNFDSAIKLIFPIFLFFLFPFVFYKSMKKVGLVLGFGLSILILIISNAISITSAIFISILTFIVAIIVIKQKERSEIMNGNN